MSVPHSTAPPAEPDRTRILMEVRKCRQCVQYFTHTYCQVLDEQEGAWVPFRLWGAQWDYLDALTKERLLVALKARQLGMTWATLAYILWLVLLHPIATVLMFSRRDDEATDLLKNRLKEMHKRLPRWLQASSSPVDNDHEWALLNGSRVKAFPCTAGDSYTASMVFIDEADLVPDLDALLRAVKPTIDAGGQMVLLSRADKSAPESPFKKTFLGARDGKSSWKSVFLPWQARPGRDARWYEEQKADIFSRTGSHDDLFEQYPGTAEEALAPRSLDKRLALPWLIRCYVEKKTLPVRTPGCPQLADLLVYYLPMPRCRYVLGGDPAEGNPTSDDSALCILDDLTGEEVASLSGKFEPAVFAAHAAALAYWYNNAALLIERNNHGWAVLDWLRDNARDLRRLLGYDKKEGWLTNSKGKAILYDDAAEALSTGDVVFHTRTTFLQLASIEGSSLRAPKAQHDDRAMAFVLAVQARLCRATPSPAPLAGGTPPLSAPDPYRGRTGGGLGDVPPGGGGQIPPGFRL